MDLQELLKQEESEVLEFKASLAEEKELLETICAFSNSRGGKIVVGISDGREVRGVRLGKNTVANFISKVRSLIEPALIPQIDQVELQGKTLLVIHVSEGVNKPYFLKGVAYKRVGRSNQRLTKEELERMIIEKHRGLISFEDRELDLELDTIDEELIEKFVRDARAARKVDLGFKRKEDFLKRLGVLKRGRPTVCAALCFSRNPQVTLPYAFVKCGLFVGGVLRSEREAGGDVSSQISEALDFLRGNLALRLKVEESGKRVEEYEIPLEALREAVVNALAHRDYSIPSPVRVEIHEDRVEVINPGGLPPPLTPEALKRDHPSVLRNPKLANFLFLSGFIERWGRGTNHMVELCLNRGLREPEFVEERGFFKVILFRGVLSELERRILEFTRGRELSSSQVARKLGVGERAARKYLSKLCSRGLVVRRRVGRRILYSAPG
jgi:ATP-dependent DNA helicase RecG